MKLYRVYYWIGGSEVGRWHLLDPMPYKDALAAYSSTRNGGRVVHMVESESFHGVPDDAPSIAQLEAAMR